MAIKSLFKNWPQRAFSRKGVPIKEILQTQKTRMDDSEHDMYHMLSKQPDIIDRL
jgi:hypothetical protein